MSFNPLIHLEPKKDLEKERLAKGIALIIIIGYIFFWININGGIIETVYLFGWTAIIWFVALIYASWWIWVLLLISGIFELIKRIRHCKKDDILKLLK